MTLPDYLDVFFDVANDGKLEFPESGSRLSVIIYNDTWQTSGWYRDRVWIDHSPDFNRAIWIFADDYYDYLSKVPEGFVGAVGGTTAEYDNSTGTLTILFSRRLWNPGNADSNGLQMRRGERWVMGFLLELGYATWYEGLSDFVDGWPQKAYPYLSNDSSWWPKLVIDLANPPAPFTA